MGLGDLCLLAASGAGDLAPGAANLGEAGVAKFVLAREVAQLQFRLVANLNGTEIPLLKGFLKQFTPQFLPLSMAAHGISFEVWTGM